MSRTEILYGEPLGANLIAEYLRFDLGYLPTPAICRYLLFVDTLTFTPRWTGHLRSLYCPTFTVGLVSVGISHEYMDIVSMWTF